MVIDFSRRASHVLLAGALALGACGDDDSTPDSSVVADAGADTTVIDAGAGDTEPDNDTGPTYGNDQAIAAVKAYVTSELQSLHDAATAIQTAAPDADADGWNYTDDQDAVDAMRSAWSDARISYERIEGAIAVLFPDHDASTDERYDGFIQEAADANLFDGMGVTGVHGIERILWANTPRDVVVAFESALDDYTVAAMPATMQEAADFRTGLCQRLMDDVAEMQTLFAPLALDTMAAYMGVVDSMAEQTEKIDLAATGAEESRYAEHTLADMRANLEGGMQLYAAFEPWVAVSPAGDGSAANAAVAAGFARVQAGYAPLTGDALPAVPEGWDPDAPTAEHLATPYGTLWTLLKTEADPATAGTLVADMIAASSILR